MNLLDIANRALAEFEAKTHRHWWIHFPDREPVEVIFAPGIKRKTVLLVYPKAVSAEPVADPAKGNA